MAQQAGSARPKLHRAQDAWDGGLCLPATHALGQHTCTEHPLWARRAPGRPRGGPQGRVSGWPQQPRREEGLPEFTAKQNDTSKSKAELPQGHAPPRDLGRGRVSPPGSLSQNPEDPAPPLTAPPSPEAKRNSPEAADAVTAGKL